MKTHLLFASLAVSLLTSPVWAGEANPRLSSRVDRVVTDPAELNGLNRNVQCKDHAGEPGPWLVVSRAWGGSPSLRHQRVLRAAEVADLPSTGAVQPGDRVAVAWGACQQPG